MTDGPIEYAVDPVAEAREGHLQLNYFRCSQRSFNGAAASWLRKVAHLGRIALPPVPRFNGAAASWLRSAVAALASLIVAYSTYMANREINRPLLQAIVEPLPAHKINNKGWILVVSRQRLRVRNAGSAPAFGIVVGAGPSCQYEPSGGFVRTIDLGPKEEVTLGEIECIPEEAKTSPKFGSLGFGSEPGSIRYSDGFSRMHTIQTDIYYSYQGWLSSR